MASTAVDKFLQAIENAAIPGCDAWICSRATKAASLGLRMQVALSSTKRGSPFSTLSVLLISLAPIVGPTTRL